MFGPADWSDSMSLQRMVCSLALDFIMPLMVGFKGKLVWGLPCRHPELHNTSRGLYNAIVMLFWRGDGVALLYMSARVSYCIHKKYHNTLLFLVY